MHSEGYVELLGWSDHGNRHHRGDFRFVLVHDVQAITQPAKQAGSPAVTGGFSVLARARPRHRAHTCPLEIFACNRRRPQSGGNRENERAEREDHLNCAGNREQHARHGLPSAEMQGYFIPKAKEKRKNPGSDGCSCHVARVAMGRMRAKSESMSRLGARTGR